MWSRLSVPVWIGIGFAVAGLILTVIGIAARQCPAKSR